jgi:hypothetical protein
LPNGNETVHHETPPIIRSDANTGINQQTGGLTAFGSNRILSSAIQPHKNLQEENDDRLANPCPSLTLFQAMPGTAISTGPSHDEAREDTQDPKTDGAVEKSAGSLHQTAPMQLSSAPTEAGRQAAMVGHLDQEQAEKYTLNERKLADHILAGDLIIFDYDTMTYSCTRIHENQTVEHLTHASQQLQLDYKSVLDILGNSLPPSTKLADHKMIANGTHPIDIAMQLKDRIPILQCLPRKEAVLFQRAAVADDEMRFYLSSFAASGIPAVECVADF